LPFANSDIFAECPTGLSPERRRKL